MAIVIATADEGLRSLLLTVFARGGWAVTPVVDWERLIPALVHRENRLVLVDPALPGFDPALIASVAASLPHPPRVRTLGGTHPPLGRVPSTERAVTRVARQVLGQGGLRPEDRRELKLLGLGEDPLATLALVASTALPVWLNGEKGTGKERVARMIHRLWTPGVPFSVLAPSHRWEPVPGPGILYVENAHRRDPGEIRLLLREATPARWRVMAGSRAPDPIPGVDWHRLAIVPLRDRPNDLTNLTQLYLDRHAARLGVGKRRLDRALLAMIDAWRWPGNNRELEQFIGHALHRIPQTVLRARDLPDDLRAQLEPAAATAEAATRGFEEVAREHLRPVVAAYEPGVGKSLNDLVVGSTERVLIHLVLNRTGGNRKRAAELLGVARNTLQARILTLGVSGSRE